MSVGIPATMKACLATGFGAIDENIAVRDDWPTPQLPHETGFMIIRVLCCALAPGDVRVLSGKTDYMQLPETGHPYVAGSDVSGTVVAVQESETKFKKGDYVVGRFDEPKPNGGLAEYRLIKTALCEICPSSIPPVTACGLPASAMAAKRIVRDFVKLNDRVLVIGGSGAVGSSVLQYAKLSGAGFLVVVSTQQDLCKKLGADIVVDYRKQKWWEMEEYQKEKFDVVFDMVNGNNWTVGGCSGKAIKPTGTYVALMTGVETEIEVHGVLDIIWLGIKLLPLYLYGRLHPALPKWVAPEALKLEDGDLKGLFEDVAEGRLQPVLDPASPFEFTESGVRKAFHLQKSIHAHGKVVVEISKD